MRRRGLLLSEGDESVSTLTDSNVPEPQAGSGCPAVCPGLASPPAAGTPLRPAGQRPWPRWAFLVAQLVKSLLAMQETQVRSLSWEDPLEKEMATHSSILAWRIPWTEEPGGLQSLGSQESDMTEQLNLPTYPHP